jgi:hypothetical protein
MNQSKGPLSLIFQNGQWVCNHSWIASNGPDYSYECTHCNITHCSKVRIPSLYKNKANHNCVHEYEADPELGPDYAKYKAL